MYRRHFNANIKNNLICIEKLCRTLNVQEIKEQIPPLLLLVCVSVSVQERQF